MMKEIFVNSHGILVFHYSSEKSDSDSDQAVLSSGLFSAIQDFSAHARSDILESFSTENEYFIFTPCANPERVIVGVFDRRANEQLAREALGKVRDLMSKSELPDFDSEQMSRERKNELRNNIDTIALQLFGSKQISSHVNELLSNRTDIPLAFVIDANTKEVLTYFARPKPLFRASQANEFLLLHSTLCKTLSRLSISEDYRYFTLGSRQYTTAVCWSGGMICVASGAMQTPALNVLESTAKMCYHQSINSLIELSNNSVLLGCAILRTDGKLKHKEGQSFPPMTEIFLSTLIKNLETFFKALNRRPFEKFTLVAESENKLRLVFEKIESENEIEISVFNHQ